MALEGKAMIVWKATYKKDPNEVINPFAEGFLRRLPDPATSVANLPKDMPFEKVEALAKEMTPKGYVFDGVKEVTDYEMK